RYRQQRVILKPDCPGESLVDEKTRQAAVAIHERMKEHEPERDDPGRNQWIDLRRSLIGEPHQALHQFAAEFRRWRHVANPGRSPDTAGSEVVLLVPESGCKIKRVRHGGVLQRDQVILGERLTVMGLSQQLDEPTRLVLS